MQKNLVIISGAGLSAESGIPTFRASNGLWENHKAEEICYFPTWEQNADKVHAFYNERRAKLPSVSPNAGHYEIARWHTLFPRITDLTQNIDDLLERASMKTYAPIHLHGNLQEMQCTGCAHIWFIGYRTWNHNEERCPRCSAKKGVKPAVVFFGEHAPNYKILWKILEKMTSDDTLVIVGTSGVVLPIAEIARDHRGPSILNNLTEEEEIPDRFFAHTFYEPASTALPKITKILNGLLS